VEFTQWYVTYLLLADERNAHSPFLLCIQCATTWFFDPFPSPANPINVRVDITKANGQRTLLTAAITVDSYYEISPECIPRGSTTGMHSYGFFVGNFTL